MSISLHIHKNHFLSKSLEISLLTSNVMAEKGAVVRKNEELSYSLI